MSRYFLPEGYVSREEPEYFVDDDLNAVWQPDLYADAASLARRLGVDRVVDVGCGTAAKLVALHPELEIVGIDYGQNIDACRARYPFGTWVDVDLDTADTLGVDTTGAVLVCGDVIEHLRRPERLLGLLRGALDAGGAALLLSTPERSLSNEPGHLGPPPNPAHTREWARQELSEFLAAEGLAGHVGLTRSNDVMPYLRTILAVVPGRLERDAAIVASWFEERHRWQRLAERQDAMIAELETNGREIQEAYDWAEGQRAAWQAEAERAVAWARGLESRIVELQSRVADLEAAEGEAETTPGPRDAEA